jgi:DNA-binding LytR/AlgR family response regulator
MKPLRVLAVDDEALALRRIEMALSQIPHVDLAGTARGGREGLQMAHALRPDVLLLDISMPGFGGFDLIEGLDGDHVPLIIFVTAYNEHAIRAFQVSAVDYLLKPLEFDRLTQALEKARTTLRLIDAEERAAELKDLLSALRTARPQDDEPRFETELWVPRGSGFERVHVADINWVEAERDYIHIHARSQSWMLRETMTGMEARLDPSLFTRVHRSALVRNDRIASIDRPGYGKLRLRLTTGEEVPVGSTYVKRIRTLLSARPMVG